MLDPQQRAIVESIKDAGRIKIYMGGGKYDPDGTLLITFDTKLSPIDIKEVRHQIALAVQGYFNTANRQLSR